MPFLHTISLTGGHKIKVLAVTLAVKENNDTSKTLPATFLSDNKTYDRILNELWRYLGPAFRRSWVLYKNRDEGTEA